MKIKKWGSRGSQDRLKTTIGEHREIPGINGAGLPFSIEAHASPCILRDFNVFAERQWLLGFI